MIDFLNPSEELIAGIQAGRAEMQTEIDNLAAENEQLKELVKDLQEYAEHDDKCIFSQWRMGTPTDEPGYDGYKTLFGYGKNEKWYGKNENPNCTCGLSELFEKAREAIGEGNE